MRILSALGLLALVACAYSVLRAGPVLADGSANVLRIRGLIIEDEQGHERILLGTPVPRVSGRKRSDEVTGMILLGESGAERIAIASPSPAPQILGKPVPRAPGTDAGIILNDPMATSAAASACSITDASCSVWITKTAKPSPSW